MDKKRIPMPAVGGSSLLIVFAVLCLTVFAMLSVSTVQADTRLADKAAQSVSDYYQADCQAEEILARLRSGEVPDGVTVLDGEGICCYSCPISENRVLEVQLSTGDFRVLRWQAVSTDEWRPEDSLNVWDGELP